MKSDLNNFNGNIKGSVGMKFLPEQKLEIPTLNNAGTYINN